MNDEINKKDLKGKTLHFLPTLILVGVISLFFNYGDIVLDSIFSIIGIGLVVFLIMLIRTIPHRRKQNLEKK